MYIEKNTSGGNDEDEGGLHASTGKKRRKLLQSSNYF
jgi:hypothetical protein